MRNSEQSAYLERLKTVYQQANEICQLNKEADHDMVVQSLLMAFHSPLENLNFVLMRAKPNKSHDKNAQ